MRMLKEARYRVQYISAALLLAVGAAAATQTTERAQAQAGSYLQADPTPTPSPEIQALETEARLQQTILGKRVVQMYSGIKKNPQEGRRARVSRGHAEDYPRYNTIYIHIDTKKSEVPKSNGSYRILARFQKNPDRKLLGRDMVYLDMTVGGPKARDAGKVNRPYPYGLASMSFGYRSPIWEAHGFFSKGPHKQETMLGTTNSSIATMTMAEIQSVSGVMMGVLDRADANMPTVVPDQPFGSHEYALVTGVR